MSIYTLIDGTSRGQVEQNSRCSISFSIDGHFVTAIGCC